MSDGQDNKTGAAAGPRRSDLLAMTAEQRAEQRAKFAKAVEAFSQVHTSQIQKLISQMRSPKLQIATDALRSLDLSGFTKASEIERSLDAAYPGPAPPVRVYAEPIELEPVESPIAALVVLQEDANQIMAGMRDIAVAQSNRADTAVFWAKVSGIVAMLGIAVAVVVPLLFG